MSSDYDEWSKKQAEEKEKIKWCHRQIKGLIMILYQRDDDQFIAKEYVIEKLKRITSGAGIEFHPNLKELLDAQENV